MQRKESSQSPSIKRKIMMFVHKISHYTIIATVLLLHNTVVVLGNLGNKGLEKKSNHLYLRQVSNNDEEDITIHRMLQKGGTNNGGGGGGGGGGGKPTTTTTTSTLATTSTTVPATCGNEVVDTGKTCDTGCTSNVGWEACQGSCNTQDPASGASCFYYLGCNSDCQSCIEPSPQGVNVDLTITSVAWRKSCKPNDFVAGGSCGVEYVKENLGNDAVLGRIDCHTYYTRMYLVTSPTASTETGILVGSLANNGMAPKETTRITSSYASFPSDIATGFYYLRICIDDDPNNPGSPPGFVEETDETNNCLTDVDNRIRVTGV